MHVKQRKDKVGNSLCNMFCCLEELHQIKVLFFVNEIMCVGRGDIKMQVLVVIMALTGNVEMLTFLNLCINS